MPEQLKELHFTVSWTHSQSQSQIQFNTKSLKKKPEAQYVNPCCSFLRYNNSVTLKKELVDVPIFQKHLFEHQQIHRDKIYNACPHNIKLFVPAPMASSRNQVPKASNNQQPAMHRKSKSKSKFKDFRTLSLKQSHEDIENTADHTLSLEKVKDLCAVASVKIGFNTSKHFPEIKKAKRDPLYKKSRQLSHNNKYSASKSSVIRYKMLIPLPTLGATSFVTLLALICMETILLSTMSSCAKTFYMHWNTSNSIFRIDNTDHIIDVNKGNLAFEFDQVHIICPVYEPGTFDNETEKYIIYNVSKVEYETCRITNADPRVIAICDKPQKLMFFTITFRPFTPQPGGLEFLPGNDYYFISTSSKDDLYRRIGGRCSTNNMKVVFKVCCATEEKNKTSTTSKTVVTTNSANVAPNDVGHNNLYGKSMGQGNNIGISGVSSGIVPPPSIYPPNGNSDVNINGIGTSINTNLDKFNRIPIQPNIIGNNIGTSSDGAANVVSNGGVLSAHGHGSINMLQPGRGGINTPYPGHHHIQTGIRINNVPTHHNYPTHKGNPSSNSNDDHHYEKHPNEVVKNEELTYNSGSSSPNCCIYSTCIRTFSWLSITLPSFCCMFANWINSPLALSMATVLGVHYIAGKALITPQLYRSHNIICTPYINYFTVSSTATNIYNL
ncbi:uncharacterized protein Ephrin isoform X1 [Drosophila bipectinata]|uniref:uncharacterized protein Ephrin isoform X1 n=1 Tax=Drosophila bipectinata TaxID=42026 RepID=UPI001C8A4DFC|nr:uncharacterized protein LOC108123936 [Drosophila bipectinata]